MVATSSNSHTLVDIAKSIDPDGSIAVVAEILNETNEILQDWMFIEANGQTVHVSTLRTDIPVPTWRQFWGGIQPTKSTKAQITDSIAMMEDLSEVDKKLADISGDVNAYRLSEDAAHIEGMSQEMAITLFTGNTNVDPTKFNGLNIRYNDLSDANSENIIDAGGTGSDNASIWLIGWSEKTIFGVYPKGSQAGLMMDDMGEVMIENVDGANGRMKGYRTHYGWDAGLVVRDWRYAVRIVNIDRSLLVADASTGANLPNLMFEAMELIPNMGGARFGFYMDRGVTTKVRQQHENRVSSSTLTIENVGGVPVTSFHGVPMRRVDALSPDEARVV